MDEKTHMAVLRKLKKYKLEGHVLYFSNMKRFTYQC